MKAKGYEGIMGILCDFWWVLVTLLALALILYFTRQYWMPVLGLA